MSEDEIQVEIEVPTSDHSDPAPPFADEPPAEEGDDDGPEPFGHTGAALDESARRIAELEAALADRDRVLADVRRQAQRGELSEEAMARIAGFERIASEAEERMESAKKAANARKKDYESAVIELRRVIRSEQEQIDSPQARLPFREEAPSVPRDASPSLNVQSTVPPPEDASWRGVVLSSLTLADGSSLSRGIVEALAENDPPILTIGDYADFTKQPWAGKIRGIGPAKQEQLDAALDHFWAARAMDAPVNVDVDVDVDVNATLNAGVKEAEDAGWRGVPTRLITKISKANQELLVGVGLTTAGAIRDHMEVAILSELDALFEGYEDAIETAIDELIASREAKDVPLDDPAESPDAAQAWRHATLADVGLTEAHATALDRGGIHNAQDLAFAHAADFLDTIPNLDDADLKAIGDALAVFVSRLPDDQLWDYDAFAAENAPPPSDAKKEVKPKRPKKSAQV